MDSIEHNARALQTLLAPERAQRQAPLYDHGKPALTAAIATLALGGAERIVLDWAAGCAAHYDVRLVVLRRVAAEWPLPPGITLTRLAEGDALPQLASLGATIAASGNPRVLCHLLTAHERAALARGGAQPVAVLHNAAAGWIEEAGALTREPLVITVSHAARRELRARKVRAPCAVVHHLPRTPSPSANAHTDARMRWRERWALPPDARVIGMIGAVKPQKDYPRALRLLAAVLARRDAYLVIVGGPVGRDGALAWSALLTLAVHFGVDARLRLPGFVVHATSCLPAFDMLLNTSRYEGLSIATLEALAAGLPVVAGAVGGQGEIPAPGLTLIPADAPDTAWHDAVETALDHKPQAPAWRGFPAHRLWTLFHIARDVSVEPGVLFVTANLNAGGAQRSLCNLAAALQGAMRFEIAVCGDSSSDYFHDRLQGAGVPFHRSAATRDCFDHAEAIVQRVVTQRYATICFWNVDAKVKLLLVKALAHTKIKLIDVSPGGYAFEEMQVLGDFQQWIAFTEDEYYERLDKLVLKYKGDAPPAARRKVKVIPNGVPLPARQAIHNNTPRIVVSGRIAPSKFLIEIVAAMRLPWRSHPQAELHLLGHAEPRHVEYGREVLSAIGAELGHRIHVHGAVFDAPERLGEYTVALILGEHQGSPNAVLEALAAGLPVIANDSGGTREMVANGRTGVLLRTREPSEIAAALARVIGDPRLAARLSAAGRRHVEKKFSMLQMAASYRKLFESSWRKR